MKNRYYNVSPVAAENALEVKALAVAYDGIAVLENVNLAIPKGSLAAVLGPNGAGKTTLLKAALGLIKPISGEVNFCNFCSKKFYDNIAYVPQVGNIDMDFPITVLDTVVMGRYGDLGWFKRPHKKEREMAFSALKSVGMEQFSDRQISKLSGGQQQRIFLARAMVQQAEIYFLDEPFKGVDFATEKAIIELLNKLKDAGKTIIVVHHDLCTVKSYFDWVTLINLETVANGKTAEVFTDDNIKKTYNGKNLTQKEISIL